MRAGSTATGRSRTRRAAAASSPPRAATSRRPCRCSRTRSRSTRRSATRSAAPGRCSRSASRGGERGRSGRAREAIEAGAAGFEEIGAAGWAERAREELGAIGGRTRSDGLTPAERRVADLVASGRTNAEVAAALFLAERTVASHLTHVYAKLGVRSRTELARRLADDASKVQTF